MLKDDVRHLGVDALSERIITSHRALELGEFADDEGLEIGLRELCGERDARFIEALGRELLRERVDAADLIADRAEFGLEDDSVEPGHAIGERDGAILLDEEARVFEARPEHAIVTLLDKLGLVRRADDV